MRILPEPITIQWDDGNIEKNVKKHSVTIQETEELFLNEPFITIEDSKHSSGNEKRFQGLGKTKAHRKLFVAFTIRSRKIRVISVRDMKRKERAAYEHFEKDS